MTTEVRCPKCKSNQITTDKKGFSGRKAFLGGLFSDKIGLLAGTLGSNKIIITCLACGNQFSPGQGVNISDISNDTKPINSTRLGINKPDESDVWTKIKFDYKYYCDLILTDKVKFDRAWSSFEKNGLSYDHLSEFRRTKPVSISEANYHFDTIKNRLNPNSIDDYDLFLKMKNQDFKSFQEDLNLIYDFTIFSEKKIRPVDNRYFDELRKEIDNILRVMPKYILCLEDIYNRYPLYLKD